LPNARRHGKRCERDDADEHGQNQVTGHVQPHQQQDEHEQRENAQPKTEAAAEGARHAGSRKQHDSERSSRVACD
jgi:hypothetical protein